MRGSPLLRAAIMVAVLLLLIIPLRSFTAARSASPGPVAPTSVVTATTHLQLTSTVVPLTFSVSHLGKVIWQGTATASPVETAVNLAFPAEGVDLVLDAKWPSGQTAAVKLGLARGDDDPTIQTAWGDGVINEVLTFK